MPWTGNPTNINAYNQFSPLMVLDSAMSAAELTPLASARPWERPAYPFAADLRQALLGRTAIGASSSTGVTAGVAEEETFDDVGTGEVVIEGPSDESEEEQLQH